ncbi:hypothetical protein NUW58_g3722 [Xylaria curta]|uniref:Uncharacterized protein n=1 Tax=Xylaria curta TaxID=42375 RepID=A0ACC1PB63_9PEZI|nr:hypothetical protein NUW58_g3722 [Xylaria curta]
MDVTMIGLENAGKTSLLRVLSVRICILERAIPYQTIANIRAHREESSRSSKRLTLPDDTPILQQAAQIVPLFPPADSSSSIPTVGFNMKRVQRGHVTIKCWDLGGQPRFRPMWERYCRGVSAIVFIVDIADVVKLPVAKEELHSLMSQKTLDGIPLLVLGNKSDLPNKISVDELIDSLDLKTIAHREVSCYGISAKEETNLEAVVQWLMKWANR